MEHINMDMLLNAKLFVSERPADLYIDLEKLIKYGTVNSVQKHTPVNLMATLLPIPEAIDQYGYDCYDLYYGDVVFTVQNDTVHAVSIPVEDGYIDAGETAYIDYWHFEDTEEISLLAVQAVLSNEFIPFSIEFEPLDDEVVYLHIPQSGVTLSFWADENEDFDDVFGYKLSYISL